MACQPVKMGLKTRIILGAAVVTTHPAYAQKTDNNAVTAAEDAFGKSVGDQSIGIYSDSSVRGFSGEGRHCNRSPHARKANRAPFLLLVAANAKPRVAPGARA